MSKRCVAVVVLVQLFIGACQLGPSQPTEPTRMTSTNERGTLPTSSSPPHWTETPSEVSRGTSSPTEVSLPIGNIEKRCVAVRDELSSELLSDGLLILSDFSEQGAVGTLKTLDHQALTLDDLNQVPEYWGSGEESPDKARFLYETYDEFNEETRLGELIVLNSRGRIERTLPVEASWLWVRWGNSEEITAISEFPIPGSVETIHAGTGETGRSSPALPQYWGPDGIFTNWWGVSFNQVMDRVVYIQGVEGPSRIILWDLTEDKVVWARDGSVPLQVRPKWSPNQDSVAVLIQDELTLELFIVDANGLSEKWVEIEYAPESMVGELEWSPDGRYLALVSIGGGPLLLLDRQERRLLDLCVTSASSFGQLLWSPESNHLLVPRYELPAMVIDVDKSIGANLTSDKDLKPVAWLKSD